MLAPEGPCQGAQGQLSTIWLRYSKNTRLCASLHLLSLSLWGRVVPISFSVAPFTRPCQVVPLMPVIVTVLRRFGGSRPPDDTRCCRWWSGCRGWGDIVTCPNGISFPAAPALALAFTVG